ncbi:SDR family oxidoreductase [Salinirubellus sp. GCM10025818]|uniref:SDR family oxidoreductase n=1 Tax=Salinirubellus TaxID=2162630 RepID=UPI0030D430A4
MPAELAERTAFVTGASAGIGEATARLLAREGADVALVARREERLTDLAAEIEDEHGVETLVLPTDVSDDGQVEEAVEEAAETFDGLDVVVSNAGINRMGDVEDLSTEKFRQVMGVNVDGTFFVTRAVIPHLRESSGSLVYVGSFAGKYPRPGQAVYAGSKWWLQGFAQSLAGDLGLDDIGITVVNPTEVITEIGIQDDRPAHERFDHDNAAQPEDVAEAVVFAAKQEPPNVVAEVGYYRRDKFDEFRRD